MIAALKRIFGKTPVAIFEKPSAEAYDLWSESYDHQPGNLMMDLDELIFSDLLAGVRIANKQVADVGCGTGRHWEKLLGQAPLTLTGFDVSGGMLSKLKQKYPQANTCKITDNLFSAVPDAAFDVVVSTLTVAHIEHIDEALQAWSRILKKNADLIITDFHPEALAMGGKRTFEHHNKPMAVKNYVHQLSDIEALLVAHGFYVAKWLEKRVDETVRHYYASKNALHVYDKFNGYPIIYGLHLKRG